jgi:hypothetical protein
MLSITALPGTDLISVPGLRKYQRGWAGRMPKGEFFGSRADFIAVEIPLRIFGNTPATIDKR